MTVNVGEEVHIPCLHNNTHISSPNVTWWRILSVNYSWPSQFHSQGKGRTGEMIIRSANKNHSGMYRCHVKIGDHYHHSCGTYLRVRGE